MADGAPGMIGQTVSHYRITGALGAGGMGEVFRATDTRLGRDVAIKVLPARVASDAERLARFRREAHVLASLNHPGIAAIHGLEEVDGKPFLVLELVEGETLAERIARGALPKGEALEIARQIAEAVEAAHERGIVHRDLKPANVKLTPDGKVKVLDFGLAKACAEGEGSGSPPDLSHSPTLTNEATKAGVILGTAAYMSPEQAKGKAVDRRADIWAFGVVLFEMLSGTRLFSRETASETLASVIKDEPDWGRLPPPTPSRVRELLRRCLTKAPKQRLRDVGEARIALEEALARPEEEPAAAAPAPVGRLRAPAVVAALVIGGIAAGAAATWALRPVSRSPLVVRIAQTLPSDQLPSGRNRARLSLSPDGSRLVYAASQQLYLRPLDALAAVELPGTQGATEPFFSPDGQWVGFFAGGQLKKTPVAGGVPVAIAPFRGIDGASWAPDDTILVGGGIAGILKVPGGGGAPEVVVAPDSGFNFRRPQVLPGGRAFLYARAQLGNWSNAEIMVRSLAKDGSATVVLKGTSQASYVPTGHLVYGQENALAAVAFDLSSRRTVGSPVTLVEGLDWNAASGVMQFAFSDVGTLAYVPAFGSEGGLKLVAVGRSGSISPLAVEERAYSDPRISPDGRLVAAHLQDGQNDVWVAHPARGTLTRLSFDPNEDETPAWSPDGRSIAWAASRANLSRGIYRRASDGGGSEELVWRSELHAHVADWSPDGRMLVMELQNPTTSTDIWRLELDGKPTATPFLQTPFNERSSRLSPDGRLLAYVSDESGRDEVYVQSFPEPGAKLQVSSSGGMQPVWARDGRAIFFRGGGAVNEVAFQAGSRPTVGLPRGLFPDRFESPQLGGHTGYDVWPDGRFLMIQTPEGEKSSGAPRSEIVFVFNFFEELKARVRADRR